MWQTIRSHGKAHPLGLCLLLFGYVIGILAASLGASVTQETTEYAADAGSGHAAYQRYLSVAPHTHQRDAWATLLPIVTAASQTVQVQAGFEGARVAGYGEQELAVIGVMYAQDPEWQAPLLNGRHMTPTEAAGAEQVVVVGRDIAAQLFPTGLNDRSQVQISGDAYRVIGVLGRAERETQWDSALYVPYRAIPQAVQNVPQRQIGLFLTQNGASPEPTATDVQARILAVDAGARVHVQQTGDTGGSDPSPTRNAALMAALIGGLILLVASVNISNLSLFWILDRRKEIAVRKALGATDRAILQLVVGEMLAFATVSLVMAWVLHAALAAVLAGQGIAIGIGWASIAVSVTVALLCALVTSIVPVRAALAMEPADVLRIE